MAFDFWRRDGSGASQLPGDARRRRRQVALFLFLLAATAIYLMLAPKMPHDQVLRFVLGDAAPRLIELDVRYAEAEAAKSTENAEDWTREATFRFAEGSAPRIVTHEPRLANGDYVVEIETQTASQRGTLRRRVTLQGGTTSIDLSESVPR
jgi:hypothetical protein